MKVVLITGAASGLGWELARACHRRGDALLLADLDAGGLAARVAELGEERVLGVTGDITNGEVHAQLVAACRERFGRLDLLINNAGITHRSPTVRTEPQVLRAEIARDGVGLLMVYPSFLDTPIERNALGGDGRPAQHARSTIGRVRSAGRMAGEILKHVDARRQRLFPDRGSWLASLLWRLAPALPRVAAYAPLLVIGVAAGEYLHTRLADAHFRTAIHLLLCLCGALLCYRA